MCQPVALIGHMTFRPSLFALLATTALVLGTLGINYDALPERVASDFSTAGNVTGHSSKVAFAIGITGIAVFDFLVFAGIGFLIRRLPLSLINVPHREYWLSPERREATLATGTNQMLWFGAATQLFMAGITWIWTGSKGP